MVKRPGWADELAEPLPVDGARSFQGQCVRSSLCRRRIRICRWARQDDDVTEAVPAIEPIGLSACPFCQVMVPQQNHPVRPAPAFEGETRTENRIRTRHSSSYPISVLTPVRMNSSEEPTSTTRLAPHGCSARRCGKAKNAESHSRGRSAFGGQPDRRVTTSALWQRNPAATQFLLKYQNTAGGVALAAVVYGVECRVIRREPAVAAGVSRVSQR